VARSDYRDVLAAAEFPYYRAEGFGIRELPEDDVQRIVDADREQYERWLGR